MERGRYPLSPREQTAEQSWNRGPIQVKSPRSKVVTTEKNKASLRRLRETGPISLKCFLGQCLYRPRRLRSVPNSAHGGPLRREVQGIKGEENLADLAPLRGLVSTEAVKCEVGQIGQA
jgi:hypothetical protein